MVKAKKTIKKAIKKKFSKPKTRKLVKKPKGMPRMELKKYKALLLKEREKAGGELSHIASETLNKTARDASGDLSGYSYHMADMASDDAERNFSLGRATEEQNLLYLIDEALKRVEEGIYGTCQQCSKLISKKRLQVLPYTALCIECQKSDEDK